MALEIYSTNEARPKPLTCFVYGKSRVGKTTFAATFPKPVFLVAGVEGNEATLSQHEGVIVVVIKSVQDMEDALTALQTDARLKQCRTIVVDSLTFYMDMWIAEVIRKKKSMEIQDWQKLDLHVMKHLVPTLHSLNKHVVWIALEQETRKGDMITGGTPMLYGKAPQKVPATTDLIVHLNKTVIRDPQTNKPRRTRIAELDSSDYTPIGGRYGKELSEEWIEPDFIEIAKRIGKRIGEEV